MSCELGITAAHDLVLAGWIRVRNIWLLIILQMSMILTIIIYLFI